MQADPPIVRLRVLFLIGLASLAFLFASTRILKGLDTNDFEVLQGTVVWIGQNQSVKNSNKNTSALDLAAENQVSACLLMKDDNHYLIEWLAYHYHVANLRNVILATDPDSLTSPERILRRWRAHGMKVELWNSTDFYMTPEEQEIATINVRKERKKENMTEGLVHHRVRQRLFYYRCMQKHKEERRHLTLLLDTDEFLLLNYKALITLNTSGPPISQPGSVISFINAQIAKGYAKLTKPCLQVPRVRFGAVDSATDILNQGVPESFNATDFLTERWRTRAFWNNSVKNRISKSIIDLSMVEPDDVTQVFSIHRPIRKYCTSKGVFQARANYPLIINHYLGDYEHFSYRDDPRADKAKSRENYDKNAAINEEIDDTVRPWLAGFVAEEGVEVAQHLLQDVGFLEPLYPSKRRESSADV